jgi:hypothetical protein
MQTALDIIGEACKSFGIPAPTSLESISDKNARSMLAALNRTAEDLTLSYNWLSQTRTKQFTLDYSSIYYDRDVKGFDLDKLTDGAFERFSASYLYNVTNKEKIPGVPIDSYQENALKSTGVKSLTYFRTGKYLIFYPTNITKVSIQFYFQTKNVATEMVGQISKEVLSFTAGSQIALHDPRLLMRGTIWRYARHNNLNNTEYREDYDTFMKKLQAQESPKAVIGVIQANIDQLGRMPDNV